MSANRMTGFRAGTPSGRSTGGVTQPWRTASASIASARIVLRSARGYGIRHLLGIARPDSGRDDKAWEDFPALRSFAELWPALEAGERSA